MASFFDDIKKRQARPHGTCARELHEKLEALISKICDEYCPGWTIETIGERVALVRDDDSVETLFVDGVPVLRVWPPTVATVREGETWVIRHSQNIQRLHYRPASRSTTLQ